MNRAVGWILLAISLVVAYQGYQNTRIEPETEELARSVACRARGSRCVVSTDRPGEIRTDVVQRRYGWSTSLGPIHVVCRREYIFYGTWGCESRRGSIDAPERSAAGT